NEGSVPHLQPLVTKSIDMRTMSTILDVPERTAVASGSKQLAVLRVVAGVAVVYLGVVWWDYPIPPEGLRFPPRLFDLSFLPVNRALHTLAIVLMLAGGLAVTAGWHHRVGAWVATGG